MLDCYKLSVSYLARVIIDIGAFFIGPPAIRSSDKRRLSDSGFLYPERKAPRHGEECLCLYAAEFGPKSEAKSEISGSPRFTS